MDLSNAFDTISYEKLINLLHNKGFEGKYLKQLANSLTQRKQFLSYEDLCSTPDVVNIGVAQGGKLSPIEFNLFMSDLGDFLRCQFFNGRMIP